MSHPNLKLSAIENGTPRMYVRPLFIFRLDQNVSKEQVMQNLRQSLEMTKKAIPMLATEMVEDTQTQLRGRWQLRQGDFGKLFEKDLRGKYASYDELRANNFPPSALPTETFCWGPGVPHSLSGKPVPVFNAQATFIDGGVVLNPCIVHHCADARAVCEIIDVWAQNFRHIQDNGRTPACESLPDAVFEKEPLTKESNLVEDSGASKHHPEYPELPGPPPFDTLKATLETEVYHFTPEKLKSLKQDASANLKNGNWISTNDAISALIWRSAMKAQVNGLSIPDGETTFNIIAVDGRSRASPKLPENHIGCPLVFALPSVDLKASLASEDLGPIALAIRRSVEKVNPQYMDSLVKFFNSTSNLHNIGFTPVLGLGVTNSMMTSWFRVPFYNVNWGPALGGRCQSVRIEKEGLLNGGHVIFPEVPKEQGGGMEVAIALPGSKWFAFKQDKLWHKYAQLSTRKVGSAGRLNFQPTQQRLSQRPMMPLVRPPQSCFGRFFIQASRAVKMVR